MFRSTRYSEGCGCIVFRSAGCHAISPAHLASRRRYLPRSDDQAAMSELHDLFAHNLAQTSDAPIGLEVVRAEGAWLYTADGRRYLDFIAGIGVSALGHGNPAVLSAIENQMRHHLHVMVYGEYVIEAQVRLAARLAELLPAPLSRVYFTNSGAEAIEGAIKASRKFTGRGGLV